MTAPLSLLDIFLLAWGVPLMACFCWFLRSSPANKARRGEDTWVHLLMADEIRETRRLPTMDYFLFKGPFDYPPLMNFLLSFLPKGWLERYWPLISPWIDTIHGGFLLIVTWHVTNSVPLALLAMFSYLLVAAMLSDLLSLNSRVLGSLLLSLSFVALLWYFVYGGMAYLLLATLLGVVIFYTHKFTMQTLVFLYLWFAVLETDWTYLIILSTIYLIAFVVHPRLFVRIIAGHIKIVWFWTIHIKEYHTREGMYDLFKKHDWFNRELWVRTAKDFGKIVYLNPFLWFVFFVSFYASITPLMRLLLYWCAIVFGAFLLVTYIPALQGLGNGERYLEYSIFPSLLLAIMFLQQVGSKYIYAFYVFCLILSAGASYLTIRWYLADSAMSNLQEKLRPIFAHIKNSDRDNIMCLPFSLCFITAYFTRKHVLFHLSPQGFNEGLCIFPKLREPYSEIIKRYNISFVLTDSDAYWSNEFHWLDGLKEVRNSDSFHLFEVVKDE